MDLQHAARKAGRKVGRLLSSQTEATGDLDILDKLGQEHDEVEDLLTRLVDSENGTERKSLLRSIKATLVPHLRAEEKVVYDAVIAAKGKKTARDGEEGYLEHELGDRVLAKLGRMQSATSPEFTAAAKVLKELVQHHVEEEERNIWADLRDNFSAEERMEMTRRFEAAKARVRISQDRATERAANSKR
jgi:hemerythrin superfamily protein